MIKSFNRHATKRTEPVKVYRPIKHAFVPGTTNTFVPFETRDIPTKSAPKFTESAAGQNSRANATIKRSTVRTPHFEKHSRPAEDDLMLQLRDSIMGLTQKFSNLENQMTSKISQIEFGYNRLESKITTNEESPSRD
jgi:hypothetical protein